MVKTIIRLSITGAIFLLLIFLLSILPFLLSPTETGIRFSPDKIIRELKVFWNMIESGKFNNYVYGTIPNNISLIFPGFFLNSFLLTISGACAGMIIGITGGMFFSRFQLKWAVNLSAFLSFIPDFTIALLLQLIVIKIMSIFPGFPVRIVSSGSPIYVLPIIVISLTTGSYLTASIFGRLKQELSRDYILYARAHGLSKNKIYIKHLFPAVVDHIQGDLKKYVSLILANLLIIERIFNIRGLSRLIFKIAYTVEGNFNTSRAFIANIIPRLNVAVTGLTSIILLFFLSYYVLMLILMLLKKVVNNE